MKAGRGGCHQCLKLAGPSLCALLSSCAGNQSALDPAGPQADRISHIWWFMFWVSTVVFIAVMVALVMAIIRGRAKQTQAANQDEGQRPELAPEARAERRRTTVISGAVAITTIILFVFLVYDFAAGRGIAAFNSPQRVTIEMTGHQWWWTVEYDDPIPSQRVNTANEIHIPAGQPVEFKFMSNDVIHSFWVPNLHGKKDLIPGQQTITWLQADKPGTYRGQCAEFCGYQHAHMSLMVIAEPPDQYNAWLDRQRLPSATPATAEQQRGQQIFLTKTCVMCHTIRGTSAGSNLGPDLTHLASRQTIAAGTLPNTRDHLADWITKTQEIKPGSRMPPSPLSADELQALLSYLESLK